MELVEGVELGGDGAVEGADGVDDEGSLVDEVELLSAGLSEDFLESEEESLELEGESLELEDESPELEVLGA